MILAKTSQLSTQVQKGEPVRLTFHYNSKVINKFVNSLFTKVLSQNDMAYLQGMVETILREMIVNAVKANTKRVFFKERNLNIADETHYREGMEDFKTYLINEINQLPVVLKENGYKVELFLKKSDKGFRVMVQNNAALLPFEEQRIRFRIEKAKTYGDFSEIYMDIADDQEGEGLGIPLTMLFLRNSGIGEDSFSIVSNGKITQSAFTIPLKLQPAEVTGSIQDQIIDEVRDLPTFPEHVLEMQALCRKKDVTITELANKISLDPSLTAAVMKLSNSAGFVTSRRIDTIRDAVKVIGLKNLNAILVASATRKIMDERFSSFRDVWNHCNKTAFYARLVAQRSGLTAVTDMVFLAGLLHDLGKIILLSTNADLADKIENLVVKRQVRTSTVLEEVSMGISHSTIGRMIAEKWNFPEYITEAITYHHAPLNAGDTHRDIVFITYLANKLCLIEENKFDFNYLEDDVLQRFNLMDESEFNRFHQSLKEKFEHQSAL